MKRIYLDHAAATPMDSRVYKAMLPYMKRHFGNPSSLHKEGVVANKAVAEARSVVEQKLHAQNYNFVFTGSGTESDNLAIVGVVRAMSAEVGKPHVITSVIEHSAVLETVRHLEKRGEIEVTYVSVSPEGVVDPADVAKAIQKNTVLVSVMYANSEIGTIQPIREIVRKVREYKKKVNTVFPYVHTDACQAVNYLDMSLERLGCDFVTFNGSKIYGPKGVGVLCVRKGTLIDPVVYGGGQEKGLRGGTENVANIVGLATALEVTEHLKDKEVKRLGALRDRFVEKLQAEVPKAVHSSLDVERLPNCVHVTIPHMEEDVLVIELDAKGVACSSKSACKAASGETSDVMRALEIQEGSHLRFSLGRSTCWKDLDYTARVLRDILNKYTDAH